MDEPTDTYRIKCITCGGTHIGYFERRGREGYIVDLVFPKQMCGSEEAFPLTVSRNALMFDGELELVSVDPLQAVKKFELGMNTAPMSAARAAAPSIDTGVTYLNCISGTKPEIKHIDQTTGLVWGQENGSWREYVENGEGAATAVASVRPRATAAAAATTARTTTTTTPARPPAVRRRLLLLRPRRAAITTTTTN